MLIDEFRQFSIQFYQRPAVKLWLLAAQTSEAVDINLLLLACWLGIEGRVLAEYQWQGLSQQIGEFRHRFLCPLRALRQQTQAVIETNWGPDCKRILLSAELELEWLQQQQMLSYLAALGTFERGADSSQSLAIQNLDAVFNEVYSKKTFDYQELLTELADFIREREASGN